MNKVKCAAAIALALSLLLTKQSKAQTQSLRIEYGKLSTESSNNIARYDGIVEYKPIVAYDSKVKDPKKIEHAWDRCKLINNALRSVAFAHKRDSTYVAYPENGPFEFTSSIERGQIAVYLEKKARDTSADLEGSLLRCLEKYYDVKIKPFP